MTMRNYIKAELYRNLNRVYFWCFTGLIALVAISGNLGFAYMNKKFNSQISFGDLFEIGTMMLVVPMFISIAFVEMIASEEQKNLTLKNAIATGLSRTKMYLGKVVAAVTLAFLSATIILMAFFGSGAFLLGNVTTASSTVIMAFLMRMGAALPLWIAGIALAMVLSFMIPNNTMFAITYVGILTMLDTVLFILGKLVHEVFDVLYRWTLMTQMDIIIDVNVPATSLIEPMLVGGVQTILLIVIGIIVVKKVSFK